MIKTSSSDTVLLHKQRERAGHHTPEGRTDAGQRDAAERDEEGDERRFAVAVFFIDTGCGVVCGLFGHESRF